MKNERPKQGGDDISAQFNAIMDGGFTQEDQGVFQDLNSINIFNEQVALLTNEAKSLQDDMDRFIDDFMLLNPEFDFDDFSNQMNDMVASNGPAQRYYEGSDPASKTAFDAQQILATASMPDFTDSINTELYYEKLSVANDMRFLFGETEVSDWAIRMLDFAKPTRLKFSTLKSDQLAEMELFTTASCPALRHKYSELSDRMSQEFDGIKTSELAKEELLNQNGESAADLVFELGKAFGVKLFENDVLYPQLHPGAVNTRLSRMVLREQFIGLEICAVYFPHGFTVEQTGLAIRARSQEATQFVRSFLAGKISIKGE